VQKRIPGSFADPQAAHRRLSGAPHPPQNREPVGFSVPQAAQTFTGKA
jgi:hypothetical protein